MTTATVPTLELHRHPALRRAGIVALITALVVVGAKGIYELVDVLDGTGARPAASTIVDVPTMPYGSADAGERWLAEEPTTLYGSPDAAERWTTPVVPEMGSADATEQWVDR